MKKKKKNFILKYKYDFIIVFVIVFLTALTFLFKDQFVFLNDREVFQEFILSFGAFGPIVIILMIILEVIMAPIPGFVIGLTAGFLFGPFEGAIYVYLGNVIGTLLVFGFIRRYGKFLAEKLVKKDRLLKYERAVDRHENVILFFYFLPILPVDVISAVFGLSKIKIKKFVVVILIGYIPYSIIVTNFGDLLANWFFLF